MLKCIFGSSRASKAKFREARNILAVMTPREVIARRDPELNDLLLRSLNGEHVDIRGYFRKCP